MLFSSTEGAAANAAAPSVAELPSASIFRFSENREQFVRAARRASERGIQGALIDPDASGRVGAPVDFSPPAEPGDGA